MLPEFGDVQVARIDRPMIRRFLAELIVKGKGPGTVKNALNVIKPVLNVAVEAGALRSNPARGISGPRSQKQEMQFLSAEQVEQLADAIDPRHRTLVVTAAYTGLRAGELVALRVRDLDLLRGRLHVRESASEIGKGLVFGPTKKYQQRSVTLPRFLVDQLAEHLAQRGVDGDRDAFVFVDTEGGPLRQSNFYKRVYKQAVVDAGLDPKLRLHDLRHTAAALMLELGAHPRAMMERLGHSSVTVTLDTYGHLLPSLDEALTAGLEDRYRAAVSEQSWPGRGMGGPSAPVHATA